VAGLRDQLLNERRAIDERHQTATKVRAQWLLGLIGRQALSAENWPRRKYCSDRPDMNHGPPSLAELCCARIAPAQSGSPLSTAVSESGTISPVAASICISDRFHDHISSDHENENTFRNREMAYQRKCAPQWAKIATFFQIEPGISSDDEGSIESPTPGISMGYWPGPVRQARGALRGWRKGIAKEASPGKSSNRVRRTRGRQMERSTNELFDAFLTTSLNIFAVNTFLMQAVL
jgi:hypothetical protein